MSGDAASPSRAADDGDGMFREPYVDSDEQREQPVPHRYVHGGFRGTQTRFSFYLPPESLYRDRFFTVVEGGQAGHEDRAAQMRHRHLPSIAWAIASGGYLVESNGGHVAATTLSYTHGSDEPSITAYRATAAATRFAREFATDVYRRRPRYGYVLGGSGGGRALLALEGTSGIWDGAVQFINSAGHGASMPELVTYAVHVLGPDVHRVVAATEPGGSGDPFEALTARQRAALATLYRSGFQLGGEFQLAQPGPEFAIMRILLGLASEQDPEYFRDFWQQPGYIGADGLLDEELVDKTCTATRVVRLGELDLEQRLRLNSLLLRLDVTGPASNDETPIGVVTSAVPDRPLGCDLTIGSGPAAGQRLTCIGSIDDVLLADFPNGDDLDQIRPGDTIHVDNRRFLAYCHMHLHQVDPDGPGAGQFQAAGHPIYPQLERSLQDVLVGVRAQARFDGKLIYVGSVHDSMTNTLGWPVTYADQVRAHLGAAAAGRLRVWLNDNATHIQGSERPVGSTPAATTRLVDWIGSVEQAVDDLVAWVETGRTPPSDTAFRHTDGQLQLPRHAADRGGLQPVVTASANGATAVQAAAGAPVSLAVHAEVPPRAGYLIRVEWDFDGSGTWPCQHPDVDGTASRFDGSVEHVFRVPGTYFPAVRVTAHRFGDTSAERGLIPNVARVRVDVS
jgi:Tannase and feruloyl esterase